VAGGATLVRTADYLTAAATDRDRTNRFGAIAVLGMALLYTGIAIANTLVMATRGRARELATLRLAGTTPGQVLRMVAVESVLVTAVGAVLAAIVTGVTVVACYRGLASVAPAVDLVVPWRELGAIAACCLLTAVVSSVLPAALLVRRRAADLAGARE